VSAVDEDPLPLSRVGEGVDARRSVEGSHRSRDYPSCGPGAPSADRDPGTSS
jgi:hypothetical protein